jgi:hypothetical protein
VAFDQRDVASRGLGRSLRRLHYPESLRSYGGMAQIAKLEIPDAGLKSSEKRRKWFDYLDIRYPTSRFEVRNSRSKTKSRLQIVAI